MRGAKCGSSYFLDDLGDAQQCTGFQALGGAHQVHRGREVRQHLLIERANQVRRHHAEDDFGAVEGGGEIVQDADVRGQLEAGQVDVIHARAHIRSARSCS